MLRIIIVIPLLFLFKINFGQENLKVENSIAVQKMLIGIAGAEPFVIDADGRPKGIAIEIWEKIAFKKDWDFKYLPFETVDDALYALEQNKLDMVVGPISITSQRLKSMRFTQPYYNSSIAIVSRIDELTLWQKVKPMFNLNLLYAIFSFLIILAGVGTLFWLAERKDSKEQFPEKPLPGIGTGMWLAIVTMSTTGYGDKAPVTTKGRIIAGIWMIISIIFATSMVAGIASSLTVSSFGNSTISKIEELADRSAATVTGSPSQDLAAKYTTDIRAVSNLEEAMLALKNKEVDAVVYDRPQLLYYLKNHQDKQLYITKAEYYRQGYGFAFQNNAEIVYDVNRLLLELAEQQEVERIVTYYLDKDE